MRGPDRAQVVWFNFGFRVAKLRVSSSFHESGIPESGSQDSGFPEEFRFFLKNSVAEFRLS